MALALNNLKRVDMQFNKETNQLSSRHNTRTKATLTPLFLSVQTGQNLHESVFMFYKLHPHLRNVSLLHMRNTFSLILDSAVSHSLRYRYNKPVHHISQKDKQTKEACNTDQIIQIKIENKLAVTITILKFIIWLMRM